MSDDNQLNLNGAVSIAKQVVASKMQSNEGCELIGDVCQKLAWPDELLALVAVAHEQYGHESLGITAENSVLEIIEGCRELISRTHS